MKANKANAADETRGEVQISFLLTRDTLLTPTGKMHDGVRISVAEPVLPCLNLEAVDEIPNHRKFLHPQRRNTTTTEWRSWMEYGCPEQRMASRERPGTDYPRKKKNPTGFLKPQDRQSTVPNGTSILTLLLCFSNVGSSVSFSVSPLC